MTNNDLDNLEILLYYRTYKILLDEQIKIPINNYDLNLTLEEFIQSNFPTDFYPVVTIWYEKKEITTFEVIIVDGQLSFNVDINTIKIKDILAEIGFGELIIYVDKDNSTGDTYHSSFNLALFISVIQLVFPLLQYFYKVKIKPYKFREMTLRQKEWNLENYQKTFLLDTLEDADRALRTLGYKRDGISMIYKLEVENDFKIDESGLG